jgi:prepilin-type N-terminal cleavage/methylation domain-containing protein
MQNGFTLIELCAVMTIMGLVLVGVADTYKVQYQKQKLTATYGKFNSLDQALSEFYSVNGRYPCPADPTIPVMSATAGLEQVNFSANPPTCTSPTGAPTGVVRTHNITRATQANPYYNPNNPPNDYVAIGAFPYQTVLQSLTANNLPTLISQNDTIDSWNNQITYAVSETMASEVGTSPADGAIYVETENFQSSCTPGGSPACQDLTYPPGSAHLVLISHGDDGVGAYNQQGVITNPCPPVGQTADAQNCQYNSGLFIDGLRSVGTATMASYFDDEVYFRAVALNALWAPVNNPNISRPDIYNLNAGYVGIGTGSNAPQAQLEVDGILHAAGNVNVPLLCDPSNCFDPSFIGGPTVTAPATPQAPHPNTCPNGQVMTGITGTSGNYQVSCQQPALSPTSVAAVTCLPGSAIYGFQALGGSAWTPVCLPVGLSETPPPPAG